MGRPTKQGIDYFPLDVGFFNDLKIRKISRACGSQSASILICLLCNIYRNNGYYIVWDKDMPFVIADEVGVTEGAVNEVVIKAVQVGFFNEELFNKHNILTSNGIQKRYILATYQRKERLLNEEYLVFHTNNSVSCANNPINCVNSTQIKKENKKEKKENTTKVVQKKESAAKATPTPKEKLEERKKGFYDSLRPYVGKYPKEMIRKFFDYWSEMNKSCTKMRYEGERTWETSKRLANWASRDKDFKPSSMGVGTVLHNNSTDKYKDEDKWNR